MVELATEAFDFDVQRVLEECGPEDHADRTDRSQMFHGQTRSWFDRLSVGLL